MKALHLLMTALIAVAAVSALAFYYEPQPERDLVSEVEGDSSLPVVFGNATNLTNNEQDSVYGQVAAWDSSVFVMWQDSVSGRNYDIFLKKSSDNGTTFEGTVNLSNNAGFSEHPQIAVYEQTVYGVWADNTPGNREVLFTRSPDGGTSFEGALNLSGDPSDSYDQEMAAFGDSVYVVWVDRSEQENVSIKLRASGDGGATFGETIEFSNPTSVGSFPKVAAYGNSVYVTFNVVGEGANDGLYFVKSSDLGSTFGDVKKLLDVSGESQVAAYGDTVYVISGGIGSEEVSGLYFIKSVDGGETFSDPIMIDAGGKFVNPLNVELAADSHEVAYVAGQAFSGGNEEILLMLISGGNSTGVVNLSKNEKISECPSIALAGGNIYVVWEDLTPGNHEVLYAKGVKT